MSMIHQVSSIAERLGRVTGQFEPGTPFYQDVVDRVRADVDKAHTRDDLETAMTGLEARVVPHLTDAMLVDFIDALQSLRQLQDPWPIDAFKEGFQSGTGQQLPDDGQAAGRRLDPGR